MGWEVGDLALCVKVGAWEVYVGPECGGPDPKCGAIYVVTGVVQECLRFCEFPHALYDASRFRKITPGAKIEGIEEPRRVFHPEEVANFDAAMRWFDGDA